METTKYKIVTQGNGLFVTVTRKSDGWDFFLQGDDATQFLDNLEAAQKLQGVNGINQWVEQYSDLFSNPAPISGKI